MERKGGASTKYLWSSWFQLYLSKTSFRSQNKVFFRVRMIREIKKHLKWFLALSGIKNSRRFLADEQVDKKLMEMFTLDMDDRSFLVRLDQQQRLQQFVSSH